MNTLKPVHFAPETGAHFNVDFDVYRFWACHNNSSLSPFLRSPAHYQAELAKSRKETPALRIGRLIHQAVLEPMTLMNVVVMPDFTPQLQKSYTRPKASKEWKDLEHDWRESNPDAEVVTQEERDVIEGATAAVLKNQRAADYLAGTSPEVSVCWDSNPSGLKCKARIDALHVSKRVLVDLKTTEDASDFERSIAKYRYHRQAAFYMDGAAAVGLEPLEFVFIAVEKTAPFGVRSAVMSGAAIEVGREEYQEILQGIARCEQTNTWPGYEDPFEWSIPDWAFPTPKFLRTERVIRGAN